MRGLMESHNLVEALPERFVSTKSGYLADLTCAVRCFLQELELALFTRVAESSLHVHCSLIKEQTLPRQTLGIYNSVDDLYRALRR